MEELKSLPASPTQAFQALGNAVNSKVVESVARALLSIPECPIDKKENIIVVNDLCA
jgi:DNA (cytosine-5)-methyltransferase 1